MRTMKDNVQLTQKTKQSLIDYYTNINLETFKWSNLPETVNIDYFEKQLFLNGQACFLKLNDDLILSLGYNKGADYNIYEESTTGIAIGFGKTYPNEKQWVTGGDNSNVTLIPCWDNKGKTNTFKLIDIMVDKLTQLYRTQDMLIEQSKKPFILSVPETQRLNIINLLKEVDNNMAWIVGNESLANATQIEVLPLPNNIQHITSITECIINIDNIIRKYLGVYNNENSFKKERIVVDEVNSNNKITDTILYNRLNTRKQFCEKVNSTFGLNISVELNDNLQEVDDNANRNENISTMEDK